MFFIYVLRSQTTGRYYVGSTSNVARRLAQHNDGINKSTRPARPWRVVYTESFDSLPDARRREARLKSWKNPAYMRKQLGISE